MCKALCRSKDVLFECSGFGLLNHFLAGGDIDFDTTIHGATFGSVIGCYIVLHGTALSRETTSIYTTTDKIVAHGIGTLTRKLLIDLEAAGIVSKSIDLYIGAGVAVEVGGKTGEVVLGLSIERILACLKKDTAVKRNLDGLQSILVGSLFYLSLIGQLFLKLLLLFIHLIADECACACTNGCTYGATDAGALASADECTDTGAYGCTAATTDKSSFASIGHGVTCCFTYKQRAC